jgi:hypothetical protein
MYYSAERRVTMLEGAFLRRGKAVPIIAVCLVGLVLTAFSACEKREAVKAHPKRLEGPCEIYDKLPGDIVKPVDVNFGKKVKLVGITITKLPKDQLGVTYYWQLLSDLDTYDAVFAHFTNKDNKILFQNDHDLCQRKPFSELKGKFIKEPYVIGVPQAVKGEEIYVRLGIYSIEPDIGRLRIESAGGLPTDDSNTRVTVEKIRL